MYLDWPAFLCVCVCDDVQDERDKAAAADAARSSSFSSPSGGGGGIGPLSRHGRGGDGGDDGDSLISKRMPYCMAMMVLLAIVYVLSRYRSV